MDVRKEMIETLQLAGYRLIKDADKLINDDDCFDVCIRVYLGVTESGIGTAKIAKVTGVTV